jgi:hypothetical protein
MVHLKKFCIFAAFKTKNIFLILAVVVFFIATNAASNAVTIKGYQPLVGLPHCKVSKCSWSNVGEDSLLHFIYFNFSSTMTRNEKNASTVNNSSHTNTSAHETGIQSIPTVYIECLSMLRQVRHRIAEIYYNSSSIQECDEDGFSELEDSLSTAAHCISEIMQSDMLCNVYYQGFTKKEG